MTNPIEDIAKAINILKDLSTTESYRVNAIIKLLIDKEKITVEEFNKTLTDQSTEYQKEQGADIDSIKKIIESAKIK